MFAQVRHALIIDNDKLARGIIKVALKMFGATDVIELCDGSLAFGGANLVTHADDGPKDGRTDIIFIDQTMPTLDGIACAKLIRSSTLDGFDAKVPIIMLTEQDSDEAERHALAAGVSSFIRKPFSLKTVAQAVTRALEETVTLEEA
jgi:CheY-like chemotaxis protein